MYKEDRYELFLEFFGSDKREEKKKEREQKYNENKKKFDSLKPKLKPYLSIFKRELMDNVKHYNESSSDYKIKCSCEICDHDASHSDEYYYEVCADVKLVDGRGKECSYEEYEETVSLARDTVDDMIKKDKLDMYIHSEGEYNQCILYIRFNDLVSLDGKRY